MKSLLVADDCSCEVDVDDVEDGVIIEDDIVNENDTANSTDEDIEIPNIEKSCRSCYTCKSLKGPVVSEIFDFLRFGSTLDILRLSIGFFHHHWCDWCHQHSILHVIIS